MKWIAVDYGERRTGLAVCDASELIVTPVIPQIEEKLHECGGLTPAVTEFIKGRIRKKVLQATDIKPVTFFHIYQETKEN